jgi:CxxC-x17-CxxC domain-containing protein
MEFTDRILKCIVCGAEFVFSAGEQAFFYEKQFTNDPRRCKGCRGKGALGRRASGPETLVSCSECGAETTVPFKPTQGRPVLCRACFQKGHGEVKIAAGTDPEQAGHTPHGSTKSEIASPQSSLESS